MFFQLIPLFMCFSNIKISMTFSDVIIMSKLLKILGTTSHLNLRVSESSSSKFHTLFTKWTIWWKLSP